MVRRATLIGLIAASCANGCRRMEYVNEPSQEQTAETADSEDWSEPSAPPAQSAYREAAPAPRPQATPPSAPLDSLGLPPQPPRPSDTAAAHEGTGGAHE